MITRAEKQAAHDSALRQWSLARELFDSAARRFRDNPTAVNYNAMTAAATELQERDAKCSEIGQLRVTD